MPNRLAGEKSPYLLQHADNPVDWFPWCDDAFLKAKAEDKPVFLSIGYATCHWCHVMAHESFEDEEVAAMLNEYFVSIKVDREERPDVDQVYMTACQALTGTGGWPLSVFLAPDRRPFMAGTYFPKNSRLERPGFLTVLENIARMWRFERPRMLKMTEEVTKLLSVRQDQKPSRKEGPALDETALDRAFEQHRASFDRTHGGFGEAPKFPTPHHLTFLMRYALRRPETDPMPMVEKTLQAMRLGGLFDQIGYGFHRYSVDAEWLLPHFEKMLYDQALLLTAFAEAFQYTQNPLYAEVCREMAQYLARDMTSDQGAFLCAEDADSEGVEGLFYTWTPGEVAEVLEADAADLASRYFDITEAGNFEDERSIPRITRSIELFAHHVERDADETRKTLKRAMSALFQAREKRIRPRRDDKVLVGWNGLMIAGLAKAHQAIGDKSFIDMAQAAAGFVLKNVDAASGRLFRRQREGELIRPAFADDYAFFVWGLIELFESTFDPVYLKTAIGFTDQMIEHYLDQEGGGFFFTPHDGEQMIVRDKEIYDGATPSSNSVAALNLIRLSRLTGNTRYEELADRTIRAFAPEVNHYPMAYTQFLQAVDFGLGPAKEIVIVGDPDDENALRMIEAVHRSFMPNKALIFKRTGPDARRLAELAPWTEDLEAIDDQATAYICDNFVCQRPLTSVDEFVSLLT